MENIFINIRLCITKFTIMLFIKGDVMKYKAPNLIAVLILSACSAIPVPVSSAKIFNDVIFESDGCVISPDRKAVCTVIVTSNFRDRTVAVGNGVMLQDNTGEDYSARVRFGKGKWRKTLIANSPYRLNFEIDNISTKAISIRSIIINRIDIQHVGSHKQVIFSNLEMKPYRKIATQAPGGDGKSSVNNKVSDWIVVGYWNYDSVDGTFIGEGLELISQTGANLGQSWTSHLQLKAHDKLPERLRSLWPVRMSVSQKKVCVSVPGYPTYSAFVDLPGNEMDGVFVFQSCQ